MSRGSNYGTAAITLLLAATRPRRVRRRRQQSTPRARTGSATPASTETADPSRRGPAIAELNLAARDAFVTCAQQHDELGLIVGFRNGQAVSDTGDGAGGGEFDTRVSAPRAIAAILEGGGQYVGVREGEGPDLDILLLLSETQAGEGEPSPSSMIEEEAGETAAVGAVFGSTARGHFQNLLIVSLDKAAPKSRKRTQDALNTCLGRAARAVD
jgi:hypothetical protein